MTGTEFRSLSPRNLLEGLEETPWFSLVANQWTSPVHRLREVDQMTDRIDDALSLTFDLTPTSFRVWTEPLAIREIDKAILADLENAEDALGITGRVPSDATAEDNARRVSALAAIRRIQDTLGISETDAAALVGVSRNTVRSWRHEERFPYPATVRRLMEVNSVLASVTTLLGADRITAWLSEPIDGRRRSEMLADDDGLQLLMAELRRGLFASSPVRTLPSADELDDESVADEPAYAPEAFTAPIKRRKRI